MVMMCRWQTPWSWRSGGMMRWETATLNIEKELLPTKAFQGCS